MNDVKASASAVVPRSWWRWLGRAAVAAAVLAMPVLPHAVIAQGTHVSYRVGFLGQPASCEPAWIRRIEWNRENIGKLAALGFNVI